jgi:hypothetical protein
MYSCPSAFTKTPSEWGVTFAVHLFLPPPTAIRLYNIFLEGPAGCGKTTVAVERMLHLMNHRVRGDNILLLVPQRTLADPYLEAASHPGVVAGAMVQALTIGGLAQRMVELFWPLAAPAAGFVHPGKPPVFLTLETAQYYMARVVRPMLDQGHFEPVTLPATAYTARCWII